MTAGPKPYQHDGIDFLSARATALLGDDAGLGKSLQLIRAANRIGARRILVVCPGIGRVSWQLQFAEWDSDPRPVRLYPDETGGIVPDGPLALIVTMDWLAGVDTSLPKYRRKHRGDQMAAMMTTCEPFDVAFVDEAHFLKNPETRRAGFVYGSRMDRADGVLASIPRVWVASATFTPLHVGELYIHLAAVLPGVLQSLFGGRIPTHYEFQQRFCEIQWRNGEMVIAGNNPKTIPALRDALRPHLLLRRKGDVIHDLPPIQTALLPLEVASADEIAQALETDNADTVDDDAFLSMLATAWDDPQYSTRRRALGMLKADAIVPWIKDFLDADPNRKLAVFAHHRDAIEHLTATLSGYNPVSVHGGTTAAQDGKSVLTFQTTLACRLFVGQTRAAGTSITLTAADTALLLEPDPSPANNYQAISRLHRIGQKGNVLAYFATVASNRTERRLADILRRRAADNEQLFGTKTPGFIPTKEGSVTC